MTLQDNAAITDLAVFPAPLPSDPWHMAHVRVCTHATTTCAACSVAFVCCSCRALRFTLGTAPAAVQSSPGLPNPLQRSRSASPAFFRLDVGNGTPPPDFDSYQDEHDDNAYVQAMADSDTCDNSACPRGTDEPATWTIVVEQFDEGTEEFYDRIFRACAACNRSCRKSFLGHKIKSRAFDNSVREKAASQKTARSGTPSNPIKSPTKPSASNPDIRPGSPTYIASDNSEAPLATVLLLQDALHTLSGRPATPAAFVATVRVRHDALCPHPVSACPTCSHGLICCECARLFTPAVARHLACTQCGHVAFTCCASASCCKCNKPWLPTDSVLSPAAPASFHFRGGAGSDTGIISSPEPDIWTPSPRSSPDEIDDLTARASIALPVSRADSGSSRASSRASTIGEPADFNATPLPTPDFSALPVDSIDGFIHPSFPDRAILDTSDQRHFLGRGDLSISSLRLYARRIFTDTTHWISAGHLLVDLFSGATINGSQDDFRRFVLLVGTQLGFGDLAQAMSESLDVNQKMADEYMRLRGVATTWKQKAKANSKDAKEGRKATEELVKARDDITAILEERRVLIAQRREFQARDDQVTTELNRVHRDYGVAIDDNTKFVATIEVLQKELISLKEQVNDYADCLSAAEHHRDKAEADCGTAVLNLDKAIADNARDKEFYEARISALLERPVPSSQPDSEVPLSAAAIDKSVLIKRVENLKHELAVRDKELMKFRAETSLSSDVNTLRSELAEAKAVAARLSGMYEQKSKDFRDSELEWLSLLGKQILADGTTPKEPPSARPRPTSRRGRQPDPRAVRRRARAIRPIRRPPLRPCLYLLQDRSHPRSPFGRMNRFSPNTLRR